MIITTAAAIMTVALSCFYVGFRTGQNDIRLKIAINADYGLKVIALANATKNGYIGKG